MNNYSSELEVLKKAVKTAGQKVMTFYENPEIFMKDKDNPVTQADFASEKVLLGELAQFNYGILSEESEDNLIRLDQEKVWIIDPLDGTRDFIDRTGEFTIMAGLSVGGEVILGCVYKADTDDLYFGLKEKGAYLEKNGEIVSKLSVGIHSDLSDFRLLVSRNHLLPLETQLSDNLKIRNKIPCGSAGLKCSLIASDKADFYINSSDKTFEWDLCAAQVIIDEAGGKITDLNGQKITYNKKNPRNVEGFLVSNGEKHEELIEEIRLLR